ncbi:MAG: group II intron reverse transcriptase/maturase [Verrucomicrobia bacterium]|nr:group II intron reverse transcriptase/maturase [Verrucomicrobiota bacterium]
MEPIDREVYYGIEDRSFLDVKSVQQELLPEKLRQLRWKLNQKAKKEPKFRFYALYGHLHRKDVLAEAWKRVGKRGKAPGVDGVKAESILDKIGGVERFLAEIEKELKEKRYRASEILRVHIPKGDGKTRPLGIPTLKDRVVQMAVVLILEPIFEADFLDCSYGFRPGRKAHDALKEIKSHIKEGKESVYDADLKGYFDTIPHDKLLACLKMRVVDRSLLRLIIGWLRAPIQEEDKKGKRQSPRRNERGVPQGGVVSPLLANVYLHWFDKVFHRSDGPFNWAQARLVRYADDLVVMARYQSPRLKDWVSQQLEDWLGLELNREKTSEVDLRKNGRLDFLGHTFSYDRDLKGGGWRYLNIAPSKKSLKRARETIRARTGPKTCFKPTPEIVGELNEYLRGWGQYFSFGYPRKAYNALNRYTQQRMVTHLNRRSQRKYRRPKGMTHYAYLYQRLNLQCLR